MINENIAALKTDAVPPENSAGGNAKIFKERFVIMRGLEYYLRLYEDGSSELSRYDGTAKKWVYLCFPPQCQKRAL